MRQRDRPDVRPAMVLLLAGLALAMGGCRHGTSDEIEVAVRHVGFDQETGSPVVVLESVEGRRILPIWIGTSEAQAIALEMQHVTPPRPLTHDLLKEVLDAAGITLERVRITGMREQTFFAALVLGDHGREVEVDSRPSDAIALALRAACPIVVSRHLLAEASGTPSDPSLRESVTRIWGLTVQDLTPVLAESLGLDGTMGVLISDAPWDASGMRPQRGDVIVGIDGTPVVDVATLRRVSARWVRALEVERDGARLELAFEAPPG